jgi:hypothetical protein
MARPETRVVDAYGRGGFMTVTAAIKAASPGDRIAEYGVRVLEHGAGVVEANDLTGNRKGAWHIDKHAAAGVVQARNRDQ